MLHSIVISQKVGSTVNGLYVKTTSELEYESERDSVYAAGVRVTKSVSIHGLRKVKSYVSNSMTGEFVRP